MTKWAFITNHGAVLALVAQHGQITARDIASKLGITERTVHRVISDLEAEGYIQRRRYGRLNSYQVNPTPHQIRPERREMLIGNLLRAVVADVLTETPPVRARRR